MAQHSDLIYTYIKWLGHICCQRIRCGGVDDHNSSSCMIDMIGVRNWTYGKIYNDEDHMNSWKGKDPMLHVIFTRFFFFLSSITSYKGVFPSTVESFYIITIAIWGHQKTLMIFFTIEMRLWITETCFFQLWIGTVKFVNFISDDLFSFILSKSYHFAFDVRKGVKCVRS